MSGHAPASSACLGCLSSVGPALSPSLPLPLQSIRDNYEKIVLSLEPGLDTSYDGIKSENLIDWLLSE